MSRFRRHLTFANVCSFIALAVALTTGGAYAANTILSSDIVDGEIKTQDLGDQAVSGAKLEDNSIDASKVAPDSLSAADLAGVDEVFTYKVPGGVVPKGCVDHAFAFKGLRRGDSFVLIPLSKPPLGVIVGPRSIQEDGKALISVCNLSQPAKVDEIRFHAFTLSRTHPGRHEGT